MELERVRNPKISFVNPKTPENGNIYSAIGDVSAGVGLAGIVIELIANQNAGLVTNYLLASAILFGAAINNLPEYKG
jgi:hypothetical protein